METRFRGVARSEWAWVLAWTAGALLLSSVPYLVAAAISTPEVRFGGAVYGVTDVYSYLAKMRQGAAGAWLFQIPYTSEPHPGTIIYLHYLLLGKLAAFSGLSLAVTYHLARVACGALLMLAAYDFLAHYAARPIRRVAFLYVVFSSGLGWLLTLLGHTTWLGSEPLDLLSPEAYVFLTVYLLPHLALAMAAMLWGVTRIAEGARRADAKLVLSGSTAFLIVALIGPFYLAVPYAVLGIDWILSAIRRGTPNWRALRWMGLSALPATGVVLYDAYYFVYDPVYSAWAAQNVVRSLHPLHYMVGYLLPGSVALLGIAWAARRHYLWRYQLPLVWLAVVPLLLYLPFNAQRRWVIGFSAPLGLFAALGAVHFLVLPFGRSRFVRWLRRWPRYTRAGMRRWAIFGLLVLTVPTNLFLLIGNSLQVARRELPIFRPQAELEALAWLEADSMPGDIVLAGYYTGNYLPVRAHVRVVLGLGTETVDAARKRAEVERFFQADTAHAWRQELLSSYGVDYVVWGPEERSLGAFEPATVPYLEAAYENSSYAVYRVVGSLP